MEASDSTTVSTRDCDALITTSLDGRVLGWSRGAQALFGWRDREILGRPLIALVHEKHRTIDDQSIAEAAAGRRVRDTFVKYVRRDGAVLSCLQTVVPMRDATGRVTGVVRIVFDLTSLRDAERAIRRMRAQIDEIERAAITEPPPLEGELAHAVHAERERTRRQFLRLVEGGARELGERLCAELASAAEAAGDADPAALAELVHA